MATATDIGSIRALCVLWYGRSRRDLPWRRHRDPYAIWVSEIMLQQTRADVVAPRYERFMARFPDVESLAAASELDVVHEWAGLGYYARARNLHAAARVVAREHAGRLPRTALASLPGIGRYTAGAIRSIAWDEPEPILDGNVARVFARLFGVDGDTAAIRAQQWDLATQWACGESPGDANQALMELGATVCVKPQPECDRCPVQSHCFAHKTGRQHELPQPRRRPATQQLALSVLCIADRDRILVVRRRDGRFLRDWWELPSLATKTQEPAAKSAGARVAPSKSPAHGDVAAANQSSSNRDDAAASKSVPTPSPSTAARIGSALGIQLGDLHLLGRVRHSILEYAIDATVWHTVVDAAARKKLHFTPSTGRRRSRIANLDADGLDLRWVSPAQCRALPLSTLTRKSLQAAAKHSPGWRLYLPRIDEGDLIASPE